MASNVRYGVKRTSKFELGIIGSVPRWPMRQSTYALAGSGPVDTTQIQTLPHKSILPGAAALIEGIAALAALAGDQDAATDP